MSIKAIARSKWEKNKTCRMKNFNLLITHKKRSYFKLFKFWELHSYNLKRKEKNRWHWNIQYKSNLPKNEFTAFAQNSFPFLSLRVSEGCSQGHFASSQLLMDDSFILCVLGYWIWLWGEDEGRVKATDFSLHIKRREENRRGWLGGPRGEQHEKGEYLKCPRF